DEQYGRHQHTRGAERPGFQGPPRRCGELVSPVDRGSELLQSDHLRCGGARAPRTDSRRYRSLGTEVRSPAVSLQVAVSTLDLNSKEIVSTAWGSVDLGCTGAGGRCYGSA